MQTNTTMALNVTLNYAQKPYKQCKTRHKTQENIGTRGQTEWSPILSKRLHGASLYMYILAVSANRQGYSQDMIPNQTEFDLCHNGC